MSALDEAVAVLRLALLKIGDQEQQLTADKAVFTAQERELADAQERIDELLQQRHDLHHAVHGVTRARRHLALAAFACGASIGYVLGRIA